jgi:sugar lactone lactonase YvrE
MVINNQLQRMDDNLMGKKTILACKFTIVTLVLIFTFSIFSVQAGGHTEVVIAYDPAAGEFPEGIAVDKRGNVYVSLDELGEIRKISPDGSESLFVDFEEPGLLGLAVDAPGNVYVARNTGNPATHGVWRVNRSDISERLPDSEQILFPNSLAFDKRGNLYVTETFALDEQGNFIDGAVWRIPPNGSAELWIRHPYLAGVNWPDIPFPFPLGANGIAYRHGSIYVVNTEKAHVVRIPILEDGSAGMPEIITNAFEELFVLDGIALDVHGHIYALVIAQSKLVRIDPSDGSITTLATADDGLDFPASLAFGTGKGNRQSVFITNFAIGPPGGAGPGVVKIDVGMPGLPLP